MSCQNTISLGAYLLGALEPEERAAFEVHLAGCPGCRTELIRLAPLPGLLNQIAPEDVEQLLGTDPTPIPQPRRRRRLMPVLAIAAAVVLLAGAGVAVAMRAIHGTPSPTTVAMVTWSASDPSTGASADAQLTDRPWGTEVNLRLGHITAGSKCKLVVYNRDGSKETAGWWETGYADTGVIPGSTSIALADINLLEIVSDDSKVLVSIHPPPR